MKIQMLEDLERKKEIANYNSLAETLPATLPKKVSIWDETLREGEQTPTVTLTLEEKIEIAKLMDEIGVAVIVAGYPAVSEHEKKTVKKMAAEDFKKASLATPARLRREDIDSCLDADAEEIPLFTAFNDLNLKYRLKTTKEAIAKKTMEQVEYAKAHGVTVDFVLEDASRTPLKDILSIFEIAVNAGADKIAIADTVGFLRPQSMKHLVSNIRKRFWESLKKTVPISVHCHNDFGLATANTLAAVEEGVTVPQTCVAGFGERAGNAPLEEVVMALETLYNIDTGIRTERLYELALLVEKYFAVPLPIHKAIVGENAFSHESGIHIHGMLAHPLTYEPIPPALVGRETQFFLGKQTGHHFVEQRLAAKKLEATPAQVKTIVEKIKQLQERRNTKKRITENFQKTKKLLSEMRKGVSDEEFWRIVEEVTGRKGQKTD